MRKYFYHTVYSSSINVSEYQELCSWKRNILICNTKAEQLWMHNLTLHSQFAFANFVSSNWAIRWGGQKVMSRIHSQSVYVLKLIIPLILVTNAFLLFPCTNKWFVSSKIPSANLNTQSSFNVSNTSPFSSPVANCWCFRAVWGSKPITLGLSLVPDTKHRVLKLKNRIKTDNLCYRPSTCFHVVATYCLVTAYAK